MAKEGWAVVVADLNLAGAEAVAKELTDAGLTALAVRMDVADEQEVEAGFDRMMEQFGSCDLVMSNAGVQIVHPFDEYPFEDWKKMVEIHADGAFLVSCAAFRRMKASGKGGRIVFTGSVKSFVGSKLAVQLCQARRCRSGQGGRSRGRGVRYLHLHHLPELHQDTTCREADSRAGARPRHFGRGSRQEHHAARHGRRRIYDR